MQIRKIQLADEAAYYRFEQAMLEDKKINPFVEWWAVEDFAKFVEDSHVSEIAKEGQTWSTFTRYFAFIDGEIAGFVICFWEMEHLDCLKLGHIGYMIAPAFRRKGIASRLISYALNQYRDHQVEKVLVATDQSNIPCRTLLEKVGAELVALERIEHLEQTLESARYRLKTKKYE